MDLVERIAERVGLDRPRAEAALGSLFMSMRMSVEPAVFARVAAAVPEADTLMRGIRLAGGRTGEIVTLAGWPALRRQLAAAGLTEPQIATLGQAVREALSALLPPDVMLDLAARLPWLKASDQPL
jgi:hypothetical protein